jgi:hypothetical protein
MGSYGRGLWETDVGALQEMNAATLAKDAHLFAIEPAVQRLPWSFGANDYLFGQRHLRTNNENSGMAILYYLRNAGSARATVTITDANGQQMARLTGDAEAGINSVVWNMRAGGGRGGRGGGGRGGGGPLDGLAPLGDYTVTLEVGDTRLTQSARIRATQGWSIGPFPRIIR